MHIDETIWETEFAGTTVWSAHNFGGVPRQDMTLTNLEDTGWLFEGTGFEDVLPEFIAFFNAGNRGVPLTGARFNLLDTSQSRTDPNTIAWAVAPSPDARKWWEAQPGQHVNDWPMDPDGYGMCTWRETGKAARIISLPSQGMFQNFFHRPGFDRLFENIFEYLTEPGSTSVPALGPVGRGILATGILGSASQILRKPLESRMTAQSDLDDSDC
jgi:hypothetical protein